MAIRKMIKPQKVDTRTLESHTEQVQIPNGCWNFKFRFGILTTVIEQTLTQTGEELIYHTPEKFAKMIEGLDPLVMWPNEYERGVAKCKLFEVLNSWKEL